MPCPLLHSSTDSIGAFLTLWTKVVMYSQGNGGRAAYTVIANDKYFFLWKTALNRNHLLTDVSRYLLQFKDIL